MTKRVLITAGQVYGRLDDNKLLGNRIRGIWASRFAEHLAHGGTGPQCEVTLLVPDTMRKDPAIRNLSAVPNIEVLTQTGFESYRDQCYELAATHDAAVAAAAVVNWIPADPVEGKMSTAGYAEGDHIQISLILAERVIHRMREINPQLTLIGCKMLSGSTQKDLVSAAHGVAVDSRAHVVVANDMRAGLRTKLLVYPDWTVQTFDDDWLGFYQELAQIIDDDYWRTTWTPGESQNILQSTPDLRDACLLFDTIADKYRDRFTVRDGKTVHGAILVPVVGGGYIASPRTKGASFTSADAVWVAPSYNWRELRTIIVGKGDRATMNAPLLARLSDWSQDNQSPSCFAPRALPVLHLHEQLIKAPTEPYAPPGTVRDNEREIPGPAFNIEGHGFVALLGSDLNPME